MSDRLMNTGVKLAFFSFEARSTRIYFQFPFNEGFIREPSRHLSPDRSRQMAHMNI